jgi:CBS domain containing-hemolysin-like protein
MPVYEEDFDKILGILYIKDLIGHSKENKNFEWQKLVRTNVLYVPELKKIDELLREFQLKRMHLAVVVDEYGGSAGIVTLEDIMEEVIGDIKDEYDEEKELDYVKIAENNYIFEGKILINDMCRVIGTDKEDFEEVRGDSDSIGGLVLELLGVFPKVEKEVRYKNYKFKIISVSNKRIKKINIVITPESKS